MGVNISLNNCSSLSFFNVYAPLFAPPTDGRTDFFSPSIFPSRNLFILGDFNCHHPLWDSRGTSYPCGEEVFDWVISFDLPFNDVDTPTLLHCFSGNRSSPDISFAASSLALSCSWEVLQDLGSDQKRSTSLKTTPSRCHFLMCTSPLFAPLRRMAELTPFLHSIKSCTFLSPFRMGLTNPGRALNDSVYYWFLESF